jgi:aldehyde:ferredoxin oxidoreductase
MHFPFSLPDDPAKDKQMHGYMGKILRINLTDRKHSVEPLKSEWIDRFIGGRGLATRIYMSEVEARIDPLAHENKIVLLSGPLVGTGAISAASCYVVTKSALTGTIACAKTRGHFGAELKYAGYDGVIIEGSAESPVCLCIMDGRIVLQPVLHLWGRTATEAERVFKRELKDEWGARETYMTTIGPAGERRLPIATITSDGFLSVGGAGIGAVMGSKNLKAIAVKGQQSVHVADGNRLVQAVTTMINKLNGSPITSELMPQWGTAFLVRLFNQKGMLPRENFQSTSVVSIKHLGTEALADAFALRSRGCFSCPIACLKKADLSHPLFKGRGVGPTYMAIGSLGTNCGITDLEGIGRANMLCAEMGLDPIATGGLFATAMELVQKGRITAGDLKLELAFNAPEALIKAMELVSTKQGHAARLGGGGRALAETCGAPQLFMGVKGAPLTPLDPRAIQGQGLHFATCNHGPHYCFGYTFIEEVLNVHQRLDPWDTDGKPELVKEYQDMGAILDSLGFCNYLLMGLKFSNLVPIANAVLGTPYSADDFLEVGERVFNLERCFNLEAGFSAKDDLLPERFTREPLSEGPAEGQVSRVPEMLPKYYALRGWSENGTPLPETLRKLGLEGACHAKD